MRSIYTLAVLATTFISPAASQETTWQGQVRPRYEFRDPSGTGLDEFTSMRVRFGLRSEIDDGLLIFIQMQDVRLWGEEVSPLADFSADNVDLHQGYFRFSTDRLERLTATVGRMETNFGGQRLVGAVDWTPQGQSFDGVKLDFEADWGDLALIIYKLGEETSPAVSVDREFYGAYGTVEEIGPGDLELYWLHDRTEGAADGNQHSFGSRYVFASDAAIGRLEATVQKGSRAGEDVSAYMFGARLGKRLSDGRAGVTLWYDYLSGDDEATPKTEAFHALFGTNHKFYGLADLFLNIPAHTGGAGLQDLALKVAWSPADRLDLGADLHTFRTAQQGPLSTNHFGEELDLTLTHRYSGNLTAVAGLSYVFQADALAEVGRLSEDMTWFYIMLNARF